jgi:hypothetical protein
MRAEHGEKLAALRRQDIEVMSYDRLLENYRSNYEHLSQKRSRLGKLSRLTK